jgi:hypothetical protein
MLENIPRQSLKHVPLFFTLNKEIKMEKTIMMTAVQT